MSALTSSRQVFVVGLVEHHEHVRRQRRDESLELGRASINVPVGLFGFAMKTRRVAVGDCARHRVEVVAVIARRHFDAARADRLHRQRIDRECVLRIDRLVAGVRNARAARSSTSFEPLPSTICVHATP